MPNKTFADKVANMDSKELLQTYAQAVSVLAKDKEYGDAYDKASEARSILEDELMKRLP